MNKLKYYLFSCLLFLSQGLLFGQQTNAIWPGDISNNGLVSNVDVLYLGAAFGGSGPARSSIGINWSAQTPPAPWSGQFPSGVNYSYADCNGDGSINLADLAAIEQNYGLTNASISDDTYVVGTAGIDPSLIFDENSLSDPVGPQDSVCLQLVLGRAPILINTFYGIAFSIYYDTTLVSNASVEFELTDNAIDLSPFLIFLQKNIPDEGKVDVAISLTTGFSVPLAVPTGIPLGKVKFIIEEDVVLSPAGNDGHLKIKDIWMVNSSLDTLPVTGEEILLPLDTFAILSSSCPGATPSRLSDPSNNIVCSTVDLIPDILSNNPPTLAYVLRLKDVPAQDSLGDVIIGTSASPNINIADFGIPSGHTFTVTPVNYDLAQIQGLIDMMLSSAVEVGPCCIFIPGFCNTVLSGDAIQSLQDVIDFILGHQPLINTYSLEGFASGIDGLNATLSTISPTCTNGLDPICYTFDLSQSIEYHYQHNPDMQSFCVRPTQCGSAPIVIDWEDVPGASMYGFQGLYNNGNNQLNRTVPNSGFNVPGTVPNNFDVEIRLRIQCADGQWAPWTPWTPYIISSTSCDSCAKPLLILDVQTIGNKMIMEPVRIFPNPAEDILYINGTQITFVEIYDLYGKRVLSLYPSNPYQPASTKLDLSILDQGCYFLKIQDGMTWIVKEFIKM